MSIQSADIESYRKGSSGHIEYVIRITVRKKQWTVAKTFADFLKFNEFLQKNSGYHVKCNLTAPTAVRSLSRILLEADSISKRQNELQSFLRVLIEDQNILSNSLVREFFDCDLHLKQHEREKVSTRRTLSSGTAEQLLLAIKSMIEGQSDALSTFLQQAQVMRSPMSASGSSISSIGVGSGSQPSVNSADNSNAALIESIRHFIDHEKNDMKARLSAANEKVQELTITLKVQEVLVASLQKKLASTTGTLLSSQMVGQTPSSSSAPLQNGQIFTPSLKLSFAVPSVEGTGTRTPGIGSGITTAGTQSVKSRHRKSCTAEELKLNIRLSKCKEKLLNIIEKHFRREAEMQTMTSNLRDAQRSLLANAVEVYSLKSDSSDKDDSGKSKQIQSCAPSRRMTGSGSVDDAEAIANGTHAPNSFLTIDTDELQIESEQPTLSAKLRLSVMDGISEALSSANRAADISKEIEIEANTLLQAIAPPLGTSMVVKEPTDGLQVVREGDSASPAKDYNEDEIEIVNISDDAYLQLNLATMQYERLSGDDSGIIPLSAKSGMMDAVLREPTESSTLPPLQNPSNVFSPALTESSISSSQVRRAFEAAEFSPNGNQIFGLDGVYTDRSGYRPEKIREGFMGESSLPQSASQLNSATPAPVQSEIIHVSPAEQTLEILPSPDSDVIALNMKQIEMLSSLQTQLDLALSKWSSLSSNLNPSQQVEMKINGDSTVRTTENEIAQLRVEYLEQRQALAVLQQELSSSKSKEQVELKSILQLLEAKIETIRTIQTLSQDGVAKLDESSVIQDSLNALAREVAYVGDVQRSDFGYRLAELLQRIEAQEKTINDLLLINKTQQGILINTEEAMNFMKVENDLERSNLKTQVYDANSSLREVKVLYQKSDEERKKAAIDLEQLKKAYNDAQETIATLIATNKTQAHALDFAQKELLASRDQRDSSTSETDEKRSGEVEQSALLQTLHSRLLEWIPSQDALQRDIISRCATSDNQMKGLSMLQHIQDSLDAVLKQHFEQQGLLLQGKGDDVAQEVARLTTALHESATKVASLEGQILTSNESLQIVKDLQTTEIQAERNKTIELEKKLSQLTNTLNSTANLNMRYETEIFTLQHDVDHFKESLSDCQKRVNDLTLKNKMQEETIRAKKAELAACFQRLKDGGDYNQELEQIKFATDVEAESLREELQVYRDKVDTLKDSNKQLEASLKSLKAQFEREKASMISSHKSELESITTKMGKDLENLQSQYSLEISELKVRQKREVEMATKEKLDNVKSKVEHYVSELDAEKQHLMDSLVEREFEVNRLQGQLESANIEINRLKGIISMMASGQGGNTSKPSSPHNMNQNHDLHSTGSISMSTSHSHHNNKVSASGSGHSPEDSSAGLQSFQRQKKQSHLTVEEVSISAKIKDPDQEALAAGILLSQQDAQFGTNMFESLREEDELIIDEYTKQGFTREEAILMIFEDKYGKTSKGSAQTIKKHEIMAMPHLLRRESVRKIAYEMNQSISQRHTRNFSVQDIGKIPQDKLHSRSPSLASVSQISLSRTSSNASLGSMRDIYLPPQSGKKSLYLETTTTPTPTHTQPQQQQQQQNLPSPTLSADGRRVVRRVGSVTEILDKFQSHQRHSSQPLQEENLFSAVGGIHSSHNSSHNKQPLNQSTRAHSMVNLNYQNPPQSQGQTHPNQKHTQPSQSSGGRYTASSANLSEEELHLVAMIMKRTGLDRPQAIQVYLSQRST